MDFLPTLVAAAGGKYRSHVDGENFLPILVGMGPTHSRKLFWRFKANERAAVRDGDFKSLRIAGCEYLFDIGDDKRERGDKRLLLFEKFEEVKRDFKEWTKTMLPYTSVILSLDVHQEPYYDRY